MLASLRRARMVTKAFSLEFRRLYLAIVVKLDNREVIVSLDLLDEFSAAKGR
jgi:hypothetical protein